MQKFSHYMKSDSDSDPNCQLQESESESVSRDVNCLLPPANEVVGE